MNTVDELLTDTQSLIREYRHPIDFERLYNRLWHCLKWQQADSDHRITMIIVELYKLFRENAQLKDRWLLYMATKDRIEKDEFSAKACLAFVLHDDDEGIVSTAALDLLAYSEPDTEGLPVGMRSLLSIIKQGFARNPGAAFGGAVSFGDDRLAASLSAAFRHLTTSDIQVAARMQTGLLTHAALKFWLSVALANVDEDSPSALSVVGSSASAIVLGHKQMHDPMVVDIHRVFPAQRAKDRVLLLNRWTTAEYANYMSGVLYELEARERRPKIFSAVLTEWGLEPKSNPEDRLSNSEMTESPQ